MGKKYIAKADVTIRDELKVPFEDDGVTDLDDQAREAIEDSITIFSEHSTSFDRDIEIDDLTIKEDSES